MYYQSRGVVLHTLKYNDNALIAHVLTEKQGCVSFLVPISHARRAPVRYTLFQPLALLDLGWMQHRQDELCKIKFAQVVRPLVSIPFEPHKAAMAMFLAEFLRYALRAEPPSPILFEYIYRSVEWLDASERGFANFHLVLLLQLTRFLGLFPDVRVAEPDSFFDLQSCVFTKDQPLHSRFLSPADANRLPAVLRMRYETMHVFKFSGAERNRFLSALNDFYQLHVPNFPELKSLAVLRDLFG